MYPIAEDFLMRGRSFAGLVWEDVMLCSNLTDNAQAMQSNYERWCKSFVQSNQQAAMFLPSTSFICCGMCRILCRQLCTCPYRHNCCAHILSVAMFLPEDISMALNTRCSNLLTYECFAKTRLMDVGGCAAIKACLDTRVNTLQAYE